MQLDKKIELSIDPYQILKVELFHSKEEIENFVEKSKHLFDGEFLTEYETNCLSVDITHNTGYMIVKTSVLMKLMNIWDQFNIQYKTTDMLDEIWKMKDKKIEMFIKLFDKQDPCPELTEIMFIDKQIKIWEIFELTFAMKYNVDDVLDYFGINNFNKLHKWILVKG